jgi:hypothetical protein
VRSYSPSNASVRKVRLEAGPRTYPYSASSRPASLRLSFAVYANAAPFIGHVAVLFALRDQTTFADGAVDLVQLGLLARLIFLVQLAWDFHQEGTKGFPIVTLPNDTADSRIRFVPAAVFADE